MRTSPFGARLGALLLVPGLIGAQQAKPPADADPVLTLKRVVEVRASDIAAPADDSGMMFMPADEPGLTLTFTLRLPRGVKLMSVQQPAGVVAADSTGADLSKIEAGFSDELEYIDVESDFEEDDDVCDLTMRLTPSARKAETFDAAATFMATVFSGIKPVGLSIGEEWSDLPTELNVADFDGPDADAPPKMRIRATDEGIAIEPADFEDRLEKIEIRVDEEEVLESNGWFSDGTTITYMFDGLPKERPLKATLTVRTGVRTVPLTVDVKKQPLP